FLIRSQMQVLLRDSSGLFYAGKDLRTADTSTAADFRDINIAAQIAVEQNLPAPLVVLNYLAPPCQLELPIRPEWFPCEATRLFTEVSRPQPPSPDDTESLMCCVPEQDPAHMAEKMSILLVEDLEDDILLIRRAFTAAKLTTPLFVF